jgi:hypothetical protein
MRVMKPTWCTIYLQFIGSLHVSGLLVAHYQKVAMYICDNRYVLYVLRLIHTYYAVPMSRPCRADKGLYCIFSIWFTKCGRVWFTHAIPRPCHAMTMPFWKRLLKATKQRGMEMAWHCELALAVQRRRVGDLPAFGFFRLSHGVPRRLSEAYQSVKL